MREDDVFLAAIAAAPDDDTARLVFADWLDEHGRRGGELIRAECALAATSLDSPRWHAAFARYRRAGAGLSESWRRSIGRHPLAHWLAASARSSWARLEVWCRRCHPRLLELLNPGASSEDIRAVESVIGRPLPPDVRESFAIHNGATGHFLFGDDLLSTQAVTGEWTFWRGFESYNEEFREGMTSFPANAVALDYANPGWIPLAKSAGSDYLGLDLAPEAAGTVGQVINFGRDERHKCALASGWAEFLADCATFLESGAVTGFDPDCGDPLAWYSDAVDGHCHDVLSKWRREGRWPSRNPAEPFAVPDPAT